MHAGGVAGRSSGQRGYHWAATITAALYFKLNEMYRSARDPL